MFSFNVNGKEYKIKFGYGVLSQTDILTRIGNANKAEDAGSVIALLPELILAGLQKKHKADFGYETESEKEIAYAKVCDLLDDYEDESTEENPQTGYTLFLKAQSELEKNGFLSGMIAAAETANKTRKTPQDHKKKI